MKQNDAAASQAANASTPPSTPTPTTSPEQAVNSGRKEVEPDKKSAPTSPPADSSQTGPKGNRTESDLTPSAVYEN